MLVLICVDSNLYSSQWPLEIFHPLYIFFSFWDFSILDGSWRAEIISYLFLYFPDWHIDSTRWKRLLNDYVKDKYVLSPLFFSAYYLNKKAKYKKNEKIMHVRIWWSISLVQKIKAMIFKRLKTVSWDNFICLESCVV